MGREIIFRKVGLAVFLAFRPPLESLQNGHIPLAKCPQIFLRTQNRVTKLRFVHPYFTYSLRYAKLARVNITYEQNPNLDDFNEIFFYG